MQYTGLDTITRDEAEASLAYPADVDTLCRTLLRVALHDEDGDWALGFVRPYLEHACSEVRGIAASCVGYLARIHREIDVQTVLPSLRAMETDPEVSSRVRDALEDIRQFTRAA